LGDVCFVSKGMVLNADESAKKDKFVKDDLINETKDHIHSKRYTEGKWIDRYQIKRVKYLEWGTDRVPGKVSRPTFPELYEKEKILVNKIGSIKATYDDTKIYCDQTIRVLVRYCDLKGVVNKSITNSIKKYANKDRSQLEKISQGYSLKFILALLNTNLYNHFLELLRTKESFDLNPLVLRKLPIPEISLEAQKPFVKLVERILEAKKKNPQSDTGDLEKEIERMVYQLYRLSKPEITIIEGTA
jgi:adenine-specific DNA-methyltransferase